jgi:hypothetical protein
LVGACGGDKEKVTPDQRDVNRIVAAVSNLAYECLSVEAGYTDSPDARAVERDVDFLVDASSRVRADARFRTATGATSLREQSEIAARRLAAGCAPAQAARLNDAAEE